ncbi:MAG TPA: ROK family protein, partial [Mariprofundaceae bacterium]|nr:ROK family protein [Mariprofundaceae bacterium]
MSQVLAIDVGGTNVRLAVVDAGGTILGEARQRVDLSRRQHADTTAAEAFAIDALAAAIRPVLAKQPVGAIGIGFPGFFRGDTGVLAASPNLPGLIEFPLAERLAAALNVPVSVQNDAL